LHNRLMKNKHGRLPSNFMHMVASSLIYDCFFMPKILEILFESKWNGLFWVGATGIFRTTLSPSLEVAH